MPTSHTRRASQQVNPWDLKVTFSPEVRQAFTDLAAAAHFSEHFDADMLASVREWGAGKRESLRAVMMAFPTIAEETFKHIEATGDERARAAWSELSAKMIENDAFTLTRIPERGSRDTPS